MLSVCVGDTDAVAPVIDPNVLAIFKLIAPEGPPTVNVLSNTVMVLPVLK